MGFSMPVFNDFLRITKRAYLSLTNSGTRGMGFNHLEYVFGLKTVRVGFCLLLLLSHLNFICVDNQ